MSSKKNKFLKGGSKSFHEDEDSDYEQANNMFNETSAIYQIHKILSSD